MASGQNLEIYTYDYLLQSALDLVPDNLDKRQGSIIYDTLAPVCYVLAQAYMDLRNFYEDTYAVTSTGQDLDDRVAEQGVTRYSSTYAVKLGYFTGADDVPLDIPIGSRFSTVSDTDPLIYEVIEQYKEEGVEVPGTFELRCESAGTQGNAYSGTLTNITVIPGLQQATMTSLLIPARDQETDEELRARYLASLSETAFGGNMEDYKQKTLSLPGVGALQIYPVWNGGGSVKLSIIDSQYNICSSAFIDQIKEAIDPEGMEGQGVGLAPIGHVVTITTPTEIEMNVSAKVSPVSGRTLEQIQPAVEKAIGDYLLELRKNWANSDSLNNYSCSVYVARIISAIVALPEVANVTQLTLNDDTVDIELIEDSQIQQIPIIGTVTLYE